MQTTTTLLALAGLAAKVAALGKAGVVNNCDFDVNLDAVPAFGNGQESHAEVLSSGDSWSQEWTSLLLGGWSIKLNPSTMTSSVMQFEYTYSVLAPNDLWFDLSYVNGNPFTGNWLIESSDASKCPVKHTAYLYPTDDANGMQGMCTPDVDITVTLCPSSEDISGSSAVSSATWPASTSSSTSTSTTSTSTKTSTSTSTSTSTTAEATSSTAKASPSLHFGIIDDKLVNAPAATSTTSTSAAPTTSSTSSPAPTTFSTKAAPSEAASPTVDDGALIVTAYDTVVATEVVTVYGHGPHHRRHQHGHRHAQN